MNVKRWFDILRQRNVISVYNTEYDEAVDLTVQFGVVSSKPRTTGRQRNRANQQVADTKDYWFLDQLLIELRCRLVKNADQFLAQLLIPINLNKLKREDELHIYDAYRVDLQTQQEFSFEVKRWKARWELYPTDQVRPSHL